MKKSIRLLLGAKTPANNLQYSAIVMQTRTASWETHSMIS